MRILDITRKDEQQLSYTLPPLPYSVEALEPYIDRGTMTIHHDKHHATYVANLNKLIAGSELGELSIEDLMRNLNRVPEELREGVRNNGGGHANHTFFWQILSPNSTKEPIGELAAAINDHYGSFDQFKALFTDAALKRFGSGWAWLVKDPGEGRLYIISTANQDTPLSGGLVPIIGLDVWEHAYYLKYQNRRPEYVKAFWQVVNWEQAENNFLQG
ncbi:MAG: hypothetical protein RLZ12_17 [Bacillota bacterium]|jgi:Fe-Mn family superoxide dismutase